MGQERTKHLAEGSRRLAPYQIEALDRCAVHAGVRSGSGVPHGTPRAEHRSEHEGDAAVLREPAQELGYLSPCLWHDDRERLRMKVGGRIWAHLGFTNYRTLP
jgi:hypothetical protein